VLQGRISARTLKVDSGSGADLVNGQVERRDHALAVDERGRPGLQGLPSQHTRYARAVLAVTVYGWPCPGGSRVVKRIGAVLDGVTGRAGVPGAVA
jgi:hypothetical protein